MRRLLCSPSQDRLHFPFFVISRSYLPNPGIVLPSFRSSILSSFPSRANVKEGDGLAHAKRSLWDVNLFVTGRRLKLRTLLNGKAAMRLLIAEDDRALGMFLSRGLEADGHRVRLAYDGEAAVEAFRQEMPDLTILDLNMPVKDGEQVLKEFRAFDADLPVLVLTARQEVDTRVRCLDLGADDLMLKPFSLHELRARCRALLRRKREARLQLRAGDLELDRLDHTARRGTSRSCSPTRNSPCSST